MPENDIDVQPHKIPEKKRHAWRWAAAVAAVGGLTLFKLTGVIPEHNNEASQQQQYGPTITALGHGEESTYTFQAVNCDRLTGTGALKNLFDDLIEIDGKTDTPVLRNNVLWAVQQQCASDKKDGRNRSIHGDPQAFIAVTCLGGTAVGDLCVASEPEVAPQPPQLA